MNAIPSKHRPDAGRSTSAVPRTRLAIRLFPPLFSILVVVCLLMIEGRIQGYLAAQEDEETPTPAISPFSSPVTGTATIDSGTILITATIWAKVTATAQAVEALTGTPASASTPTGTPTGTPTPSPTPSPTSGPDQILDRQIDELIAQMSVPDRVGQLFVVDFQGSRITNGSAIAELIRDYRIGGVVLSVENENFSNEDPNAPRQIATVANQLQALAYHVLLPAEQALDPPEELFPPLNTLIPNPLQQVSPNLPLLIGMEQDGDRETATSLRSGFTILPPQMALGATWNPELVEAVGAVVGQELATVGVNLLLGPNLDVLEQPRPEPAGGLGVYTFGGDAYWVGRLGQAYVEGVHVGSGGRVATIARHFPGQGGSDRRPDEEVATIQKSLQELRHIELLPFASVTQNPSSLLRTDGDPAATDGLMSGHIRYSSFQGSRERTPPISLAKELGTILALEEFATWRQGGGVIMSDALGVPSIRRYYDPTLQEFPRKRIALEAFLAGNDLLYLSRFSLDGDWEEAQNNVRETILFFRERYTSDKDFAARVDESLRRILRMKLRLYAEDTTPDEGEQTENSSAISAATMRIPLDDVLVTSRLLRSWSVPARESAQATVGEVAREALTILYPDPRGITDPLPAAPQPEEQILIFSDSRSVQECNTCPAHPAIAPDALEGVMLRLYGPDATGQLRSEQLTSLTFEQLNALLNDTASTTEAAAVEAAIDQADWLIFAMLDVDVASYQSSDAVKQFLRLRSDRMRGKRLVVLALNAPYFLDSTEISKLNAYIGVYSKTQPFLEAAVRAIFRAIPAPGAPPVSVPGTRYSNLIERLEPDPNQTISLYLLNDNVIASRTENDEAAERVQADLAIGDVIAVETGPILDHNSNPVPDGTLVDFRLIYEGEELALPTEPVPTRDGKARIGVKLERAGTLRISASSVEANISTIVLVSIQEEDQAASIEFVRPTATPEPIPAPTDAPVELLASQNNTTTNGVSGTVDGVGSGTSAASNPRVDVLTLALAFITQLVMLGLLLVVLVRVMPRTMLVYRLLWALLVGWASYIFYGLGWIPGGTWLQLTLYPWGVIPVVFIGMLLPLVWLQLRME